MTKAIVTNTTKPTEAEEVTKIDKRDKIIKNEKYTHIMTKIMKTAKRADTSKKMN